jgi:outer membrane protein assembly factor BamB
MEKIIFEDVKAFSAHENLIFLNRSNSFECLSLVTNQLLFKKDSKYWFYTIVNGKCFAQTENVSDILVLDLDGNLLHVIDGRFYLWKFIIDNNDLIVPGKSDTTVYNGYKIDLVTLQIKEKFETYKVIPKFFINGIGCAWYANIVYGYNIISGERIWEYRAEEGVTVEGRYCYLNNGQLIITFDNSEMVALNLTNGERIWKSEARVGVLTMHPANKNLYGISGETYEVMDSTTGEHLVVKELNGISERYGIDILSGYTRVYEDGLYFDSSSGSSKMGKINIDQGEIEFVIDLNIPDGIGTGVPVSYKDWIFIHDDVQKLHVYRKV